MFLVELINVQAIINSIRFRVGKYAYQSHVWKLQLKPPNLYPPNVQKNIKGKNKVKTKH